jgi:hypothetical protein
MNEGQATTEMAGTTACGKRWADILASFERNLGDLVSKHPTCIEEIKLIQVNLITIGQLINDPHRGNGNSAEWKEITTRAEDERAVLCKHLEGKALFAAILRLYATTHTELRGSLLPVPEQVEPTEEFRDQRRRKRNPSDEQPATKKTSVTNGSKRPFTTTIRAEKMELPLQLKRYSPQPCRPTSPFFSRSYGGLHTYW